MDTAHAQSAVAKETPPVAFNVSSSGLVLVALRDPPLKRGLSFLLLQMAVRLATEFGKLFINDTGIDEFANVEVLPPHPSSWHGHTRHLSLSSLRPCALALETGRLKGLRASTTFERTSNRPCTCTHAQSRIFVRRS